MESHIDLLHAWGCSGVAADPVPQQRAKPVGHLCQEGAVNPANYLFFFPQCSLK